MQKIALFRTNPKNRKEKRRSRIFSHGKKRADFHLFFSTALQLMDLTHPPSPPGFSFPGSSDLQGIQENRPSPYFHGTASFGLLPRELSTRGSFPEGCISSSPRWRKITRIRRGDDVRVSSGVYEERPPLLCKLLHATALSLLSIQ